MFEELQKNLKIDDAAIEKYYNEHKSEFEVLKARHILIRVKGAPMQGIPGKPELTDEEALAKAQSIRKRLDAGEDFATLAKAESDDTGSNAQGGDLGEFRKGMMVPPFEEAALVAKVGVVTDPVKTPFGYHLIKVESHVTKPMAEVRADIETKLRPELANAAVAAMRKNAAVQIDEAYFGPPRRSSNGQRVARRNNPARIVMARLFAGTSGFSYPAWKPAFYPKDVPAKKFLEYYATRLNSVEANYTFRRLASASVFQGWLNATPPGFAFACKAHQTLTHIMKMKEAESFTQVFLSSLEPLRAARRLGPVLFQFPPTFKCDLDRLDAYLPLLPADIRFAFEFRNASWLTDAVYERLSKRNIALCLAESDKLEVPKVMTADFGYFRLRKGDYSEAARHEIAGRIRELLDGGRDAYVYFKHEEDPNGAIWAEDLLKELQPPTVVS